VPRSSLSQRLANVRQEPSHPVPLAERGRMYFLRDVQELLGRDEAGAFRKSLWWIKNNFAPDTKRKLGRDPYWWEVDVLRWLDEQRGTR